VAGSHVVTIIAAADGSALGNPGPAGWAWYIDDSTWRCGGWKRGTNNQGELTAVLDLLRQTAHTDEPLHILCDSQYVINSVTKWMKGWKRKGWKKADGKPVLNVEVMKALDEAMQGREVTFEWVKGHAGHELNEKADALANGAAKAHSSRKEPEPGPGFPGATAVGAGEDPAVPPPAAGGAARRSPSAGGSGTSGTTTRSAAESEPDLFSLDANTPAGPADEEGSSPSAAGPGIEDLVVDLERSLLTDAVRRDRRTLTRLLDVRWRQVDAAGRTRTRRQLGDTDGSVEDVELEVVETRRLGDDAVLVLWRATAPGGEVSLGSSLWQRFGGDWKQVYQQATREA
ncbi:RNase H family protein, partial [Dietzia cinnamea]